MSFPSPCSEIGGYRDDNRPDGFLQTFSESGLCSWSSAAHLWIPISPPVHIQPATPMNSPTTSTAVPAHSLAHSLLQPYTTTAIPVSQAAGAFPRTFPPLLDVQEPHYTLSARMLLAISPPVIPLGEIGDARPSS